MRLALPILLWSGIHAASLQAGPWMHDESEGFIAASGTLRRYDAGEFHNELNYFAEYGWSDRLTTGIDLHQSDRSAGHALFFTRLPVRLRQNSFPMAVTMSIGGAHQEGDWRGMYRLIFSVGRSFHTARGSGWISTDTALEQIKGVRDPVWKLDATLGLNTPGKVSPMLQIETSYGQSLSYAIIPSLRYKLSNGREVVFGLEHKQAVGHSLGIRFGLWQRF